jgi:hypothetical protein
MDINRTGLSAEQYTGLASVMVEAMSQLTASDADASTYDVGVDLGISGDMLAIGLTGHPHVAQNIVGEDNLWHGPHNGGTVVAPHTVNGETGLGNRRGLVTGWVDTRWNNRELILTPSDNA